MKSNLIWSLLFVLLAFIPICAQNADTSKRFSTEFVKAARRAIPLIRETAVAPPRDLVVQRILRMADAEAEIQTHADQVVFMKMQSASEGGWDISIVKAGNGTLASVDENTYSNPADNGSDFRIDSTACQYIYNLAASALGVGTYRVDININKIMVGHAVFALK